MTCRNQLLRCATRLREETGKDEFTVADLIHRMKAEGTAYRASTIRTHIISRMCRNAPPHDAVKYDDFEHAGRGVYRLRALRPLDPARGTRSGEFVLRRVAPVEPPSSGPAEETGQGRLFAEGTRLTCRDQLIRCAAQLREETGKDEFTVAELIHRMKAEGTTYRAATIRTHIIWRMCSNAAPRDATKYDDFEHVRRGVYSLTAENSGK